MKVYRRGAGVGWMEEDVVVVASSSHHIFCSSSSSRALTPCPDPTCVRLPTSVVVPCGTSVASLRPTIVSSAHYAFYCQRSHFDGAFECPAFCRRVPATRYMPHLLAWSASHASLRLIIAHSLPRSLARTSRLRRWRPCRFALVTVLPALRYTHPVCAASARHTRTQGLITNSASATTSRMQ